MATATQRPPQLFCFDCRRTDFPKLGVLMEHRWTAHKIIPAVARDQWEAHLTTGDLPHPYNDPDRAPAATGKPATNGTAHAPVPPVVPPPAPTAPGYPCPHCPETFVNRSGLEGHVKGQHPLARAALRLRGKPGRPPNAAATAPRAPSRGATAELDVMLIEARVRIAVLEELRGRLQ